MIWRFSAQYLQHKRKKSIALLLLVLAVGAIWYFAQRQRLPEPAFAQTIAVDTGSVTLHIGELIDGQRRISMWVRDQQGRPVDLQAVEISFSMPYICTDTIGITLPIVGQGHFATRGAFFGMTGAWVADITLRSADVAPERARLVVPIATTDVQVPFTAEQALNTSLLATGKQLYGANCASCHGSTGRGDGPQGVGLAPAPSNLVEHMIPGKHTDAQTYLTISNGRRGTAMLGWGERLSEDEIWQLVAYLRAFAQPDLKGSLP